MKQIIFSLFLLIPTYLISQTLDRVELLSTDNKMSFTLNMIRYYYAEKPDMPNIVEKGIVNMLKELDPHSVYITKEEIGRASCRERV